MKTVIETKLTAIRAKLVSDYYSPQYSIMMEGEYTDIQSGWKGQSEVHYTGKEELFCLHFAQEKIEYLFNSIGFFSPDAYRDEDVCVELCRTLYNILYIFRYLYEHHREGLMPILEVPVVFSTEQYFVFDCTDEYGPYETFLEVYSKEEDLSIEEARTRADSVFSGKGSMCLPDYDFPEVKIRGFVAEEKVRLPKKEEV